jgi:predicted PurR-regulated permease PerM
MSALPPTLPPMPTPSSLPRVVTTALTLLALALVIAGLHFGAAILVPLALAVLLAFLLDPLVTRLRRWRWPRVLAVTAVMLCTVAVLGATSVFVGSQLVQIGKDLPTYQTTIQAKLRALREKVTGRGLVDASRVIGVVENELEATRRALEQPVARGREKPMRVQVEPAPPSPVRTLGTLIGPVLEPAANAGIVLVLTIFILLGRHDLRDRVLRLVGGDLPRMTDAMGEAGERVSRYLTMQLLVNVGYGIPLAAGLALIGVPGAVLWGLLAAVLRFVPYIGPVIAGLFPLTMAFAVDPGWGMLLMTLALVITLELIVNNLAEPWLYGASTGLAPVAVLVSAVFWTVLWGPIGLLLATPLTVCLVVMGRHLPHLQFLDVLFGDTPVFDAPTRLYQRLLAGEHDEAMELAQRALKRCTLGEFYEQTALPALRLAVTDRALPDGAPHGLRPAPPSGSEPLRNGRAGLVEHRQRVTGGMARLLDALRQAVPAPVTRDGPTVWCIGARWQTDLLAAEMLAHLLACEGLAARALPASMLVPGRLAPQALADLQVVCLSSFSARPQVPSRALCRRLRALAPNARIVLAWWNAPADLLKPGIAETLGAHAVAHSLPEALLLLGEAQRGEAARS